MRYLISLALALSAVVALAMILRGPPSNWWLSVFVIPLWILLELLVYVLGVVVYLLKGLLALYRAPGTPCECTEVVLPDGAPTTAASDEWGHRVGAKLALHGFVPRARYRTADPNSDVDFGQRLDNPLTGEVAVIFAGGSWSGQGSAAQQIRQVFFFTRFEDGSELVTSNAPYPSVTPPLPGQRYYRLPEAVDAAFLYSIHQRLVQNDGRKPMPIVLGDDPLVWEREQQKLSIAVRLSSGVAVHDEKAGTVRPTLKGALRSLWLLHPWFAVRHNRSATKKVEAALKAVPA